MRSWGTRRRLSWVRWHAHGSFIDQTEFCCLPIKLWYADNVCVTYASHILYVTRKQPYNWWRQRLCVCVCVCVCQTRRLKRGSVFQSYWLSVFSHVLIDTYIHAYILSSSRCLYIYLCMQMHWPSVREEPRCPGGHNDCWLLGHSHRYVARNANLSVRLY